MREAVTAAIETPGGVGQGEIDELISEHVLELRYKPDSRVLDQRGSLAASFSEYLKLSEWRITQNRVDVYDKEQTTRVFASFRNAGVVVRNPTDSENFPRLASKFVNFLSRQRPFNKTFPLVRLGVRSRFGFASQLPFSDLFGRFSNRVIDIQPEVRETIGGVPIDIAFPMDFDAPNGRIHSNSGPMESEQLRTFFGFHPQERLPEVALYIEFDYSARPQGNTSATEIISALRDYAARNWDNAQRLRDIVMED